VWGLKVPYYWMRFKDEVSSTPHMCGGDCKEDKMFTEKDIKISRWSGGKHWYAKVGPFDVRFNNEYKWFSEETAHKKALKFLEELRKIIKDDDVTNC